MAEAAGQAVKKKARARKEIAGTLKGQGLGVGGCVIWAARHQEKISSGRVYG